MQANVLNANTGYIIEAVLELSTKEVTTAIWIVTTNILPYGGKCQIESSHWGDYIVIYKKYMLSDFVFDSVYYYCNQILSSVD